MNLVLSLVALALGPVLYGVCRKAVAARSSLEGFLFASIAGIVVVHIVPGAYDIAGFSAIAFLLLGIGVAFTAERSPAAAGSKWYSGVVMLGALGLIVHAAMDGIALLPGEHLHDGAVADEGAHAGGLDELWHNHLALGVILHRVPVGMAIWWTLRPYMGSVVASAALGLIAAGTTAAYLLGEPVIELLQTDGVALFQAFVGGTLLHIIVFSSAVAGDRRSDAGRTFNLVGERLGVTAGLFLVFLVPHAH